MSNFQNSVFQAIVFTGPEYKSVFTFLNNLLMSYPAISRSFPVTPLATLLVDYPRQVIVDIVAEIMTAERVLSLRYNPLELTEFLPVMKQKPIQEAELRDRYHNWYTKSAPLGIRKKLKIMEEEQMKTQIRKSPKK